MTTVFRFLKFGPVCFALLLVGVSSYAQTLEFPVLDTLPVLDSLDEFALNDQARLVASRAAEIQQVYQQTAENAAATRTLLEQQLDAAKTDSTATPEFRKELSEALKAAKKTEKAANKQAQKAQKVMDYAETVADADAKKQRQYLPRAYANVAALLPKPVEQEEQPIANVIGPVAVAGPPDLAAVPSSADTVATPVAPADSAAIEPPAEEKQSSKNKKEKKSGPAKPAFAAYTPANDVLLNPPVRDCRLTADTRDEFSGERRRELAPEELFRFTTPALRPYLQHREHIICTAHLAVANGIYLLNLTFTINDVNARRAFGSLPRNGVAILKLLDGETLTLYNLKTDEGQPDATNTTFTFRGQYTVEPGMFKKLQKTLFDKVRIAWSTGYEDYEVHNVDLLARQLSCLLKK